MNDPFLLTAVRVKIPTNTSVEDYLARQNVVANHLPNGRLPKNGDYVVTQAVRTQVYVPGRGLVLRTACFVQFMTYEFFRKHYVWSPPPGFTSRQSTVCTPK